MDQFSFPERGGLNLFFIDCDNFAKKGKILLLIPTLKLFFFRGFLFLIENCKEKRGNSLYIIGHLGQQ